ncbi:PREDICTED: C-type lectin domain family 10 member A-like, partial [Nanorana parkeri]|uniref:C-type lectin domain family 10 member A-like n=1 Tax=Nanorana parkeri TaxID=125878 RepID=UPI000854AE95
VDYGSSCYYLFRHVRSWLRAKENCEQKKAHLVVINSREEMNFINKLSRSVSVWIGLSDRDGSWKWVDGTPYEKTPKFWKPGQPDDWFDPSEGEGEDCTHTLDGDKWNDIRCSMSFPYVCEKTKS